MNDIFSFRRFILLVKKFTKEHASAYLLYLAGLFGIILLVYGLTISAILQGRFQPDIQFFYYVTGLLLMSAIFSGSFYGFFGNKAKAIQYVNLPASNLEKLSLGFLFTQIVFFAGYILAFYVADQLVCQFYDHFHKLPANVPVEFSGQYKAVPFDFINPKPIEALVIAFLASSVMQYGSLGFERNGFFKSALVLIAGAAALMFYNYYSAKGMIPETAMPRGKYYSEGMRIGEYDNIKGIVFLPASWNNFMSRVLPVIFYILFWTASYFKLKEKQV